MQTSIKAFLIVTMYDGTLIMSIRIQFVVNLIFVNTDNNLHNIKEIEVVCI